MNTLQTSSRSHLFSPLAIAEELWRREPVLAAFTLVMLVAMVPTLVAMAVETRTFNGVNVWLKPFKFQLSSAIFYATLALFWPYLDADQRARRSVRASRWVIGWILFFEVAYITYRASQAEASHFNYSTPTAANLYVLMGVSILVAVAVAGWIGWLILRSHEGSISRNMRLAVGLGIVAGCLLGGASALYLSQHGGHWVGGLRDDATGLPFVGWSRTGGDLRVAHFIGLHAMQGLPLIGLLTSRLSEATGRAVIWFALAVWCAVTLAVFLQAVAGRPFLPL